MGKYQKNIEAARSVTIMQYLATCHPGELVRKTDDEYCTKTHSSLVITPSKDLFHWFSQNIGGRSALDYMTNVERVDFVSAVRFLNNLTPVPVSSQMAKMPTPTKQQKSREFELPKADKKLRGRCRLPDAPRYQPKGTALLRGQRHPVPDHARQLSQLRFRGQG